MSKSNRNIVLIFMTLCIIINIAVISNFSMYSLSKSEIIKEVDTVHGIGDVLSQRVADKTIEIIENINQVNKTNMIIMKVELYVGLILIIGCMMLLLMMWTNDRFNENEQRSYSENRDIMSILLRRRDGQ